MMEHHDVAPVTGLHVDEARCSGCRACEVACSVRHEGRFGSSTARIHVLKVEAEGVERPRVCRACADAPCMAACPTAALTRDAARGSIVVDAGACIFCCACQPACPFEALWFHPVTGLPLVCDLCGGDPACVVRCATGALAIGREADPEGGRA